MSILSQYKSKWLPADIIFAVDALSNATLASQYHDTLVGFGLDPITVNVCVSIAEVIRILVLIHQKHTKAKK
jgi:hypothetical protein